MSSFAANGPIVLIFSLAYGLGHPGAAPLRPQVLDKTLATFHRDLNETGESLRKGLAELIATNRSLTQAAAAVGYTVEPPVTEAPRLTAVAKAAPAPAETKQVQPMILQTSLAEVPRISVRVGFTELKGR